MDLTRLVERQRELRVIEQAVAAAYRGAGGVVVIEGPPGVGKTRLLDEARDIAASSTFMTLGARCTPAEREFGFGAVRQLFARLEPAAPEPADPSFGVLHGLYWRVVDAAAERPLALLVDDVQWCDTPSLRFLAFLALRLDELRATLLCSLRSTDPGASNALLTEILRRPETTTLRTGPLSRAAAAAVVAQRLAPGPDERFTDALHEATAGNPLLLEQALAGLRADAIMPTADNVAQIEHSGVRAIAPSVRARLAQLDPKATTVVRAAAVLGPGAAPAGVAHLSGLRSDEVVRQLRLLEGIELLAPEAGTGLRFAHPLVQEAIYRDLDAADRDALHLQAARHLIAEQAPDDLIASHLLVLPRGGETWVVERLEQAAAAAAERTAPESAVAYLRRALDEPPAPERRVELLLKLGVLELMSDFGAAAQTLDTALGEIDDAQLRATVSIGMAQALYLVGKPDEAVAVAQRAAADLDPDDRDLAPVLEALQLVAPVFGHEVPDSVQRARRVAERAPGPSYGDRVLAGAAGLRLARTGEPAETCLRLARHAIEDESVFDREPFLVVAALLTMIYADREETLAVCELMEAGVRRSGSEFGLSGLYTWRGYALLRRGQLEAAIEDLRRASEFDMLFVSEQDFSAVNLIGALIERGDLAGAEAVMTAGRDVGSVTSASDPARVWWQRRAELLLAREQYAPAVRAADELAVRSAHIGNPAVTPWRSLKAMALDGLGRRAEAEPLVEAELALAQRWGAPATIGRTLRVKGAILREDGVGDLTRAVELLDGTPARLELGKALAAQGRALRIAGRPGEARTALDRALHMADICGSAPLSRAVRSDLDAMGTKVEDGPLWGVESLTASERRVADLAAQGCSNREVAESLLITPKTVEAHLSSAYRKLGISSRVHLEAALS